MIAPRAQARDLAIPRCTLAEAVDLIARGTGTSIGITDPHLLKRRITPKRVTGKVDSMLRQILGDGVVLRRLGRDVWLIVGVKPFGIIPIADLLPVRPNEEMGHPIVVMGKPTGARSRLTSVSARTVSGTEISPASGIRGVDAVADRLALMTSTHLGPGREKLFLRGIADSSFAGTRASTVAPYFAEQRLTYRAPDPGLLPLDLQEVDVLPGPQGTIYGSSSLGGVLRLLPNPPDLSRTTSYGWTGVSATKHGAPGYDLGGVLNVSMIEDRIALRGVAYTSYAGGYIDDVARNARDVNQVRTRGGRLAVRFDTGDWRVDLNGVAQSIHNRDAQYAQPALAGSLGRSAVFAEPAYDRMALAAVTLLRDISIGHFSFNIGGVNQHVEQRYAAVALDERPVVYVQSDLSDLLTAEIRAWRDPARASLSWISGVSLLSSRARQYRTVMSGAQTDLVRLTNDNTELNAFGELTLPIGQTLSVIGGLRVGYVSLDGEAGGTLESLYFSREQRPIDVSRHATRILPSVAASIDLGKGARGFARYERGYRPGGVAVGNVSREFLADRMGTFELGVSAIKIGPIAIDATLAWSRWQNVQGDLITPAGLTYTENIGDAAVFSFDIAAHAQITEHVQILGAAMAVRNRLRPLGYLSEASHSLPNVPKLSLRGEMRFHVPVGPTQSIAVEALALHESASHLGAGPHLDLPQGRVTRIDVAGKLNTGDLTIAVSVDNLLDDRGNRFALGNPFTLRTELQTTPQRPRTIRVGLEANF
ncbi:hypothetical protein PMI02_00068 [Novosphingobium sp. AP12]|nr:hypothetical protein PMI02_00068 [Novosphingobium sp. AP12]